MFNLFKKFKTKKTTSDLKLEFNIDTGSIVLKTPTFNLVFNKKPSYFNKNLIRIYVTLNSGDDYFRVIRFLQNVLNNYLPKSNFSKGELYKILHFILPDGFYEKEIKGKYKIADIIFALDNVALNVPIVFSNTAYNKKYKLNKDSLGQLSNQIKDILLNFDLYKPSLYLDFIKDEGINHILLFSENGFPVTILFRVNTEYKIISYIPVFSYSVYFNYEVLTQNEHFGVDYSLKNGIIFKGEYIFNSVQTLFINTFKEFKTQLAGALVVNSTVHGSLENQETIYPLLDRQIIRPICEAIRKLNKFDAVHSHIGKTTIKIDENYIFLCQNYPNKKFILPNVTTLLGKKQ